MLSLSTPAIRRGDPIVHVVSNRFPNDVMHAHRIEGKGQLPVLVNSNAGGHPIIGIPAEDITYTNFCNLWRDLMLVVNRTKQASTQMHWLSRESESDASVL